jgi:hypothetical protein
MSRETSGLPSTSATPASRERGAGEVAGRRGQAAHDREKRDAVDPAAHHVADVHVAMRVVAHRLEGRPVGGVRRGQRHRVGP